MHGLHARIADMTHLDTTPLFTPITINGVTLPNRFVMPAMQRGMAADGDPSLALAEIYRSRVEGGVGLVISESTAIDHWSANWQPNAVRMEPRTIGSWKRLISAVKDAGGVFFQQLWHPGAMRVAPPGKTFERPSLSPSGLVQAGNVVGRAMTLEEMEEIKLAYVQAALITKGLGADGVEVHGAHGYLLDQFLWRETNLREDGYGGDALEDRLRFPAEVVAAIRFAVGPDFPISYRFSQWKEIDFEATVVDSPQELELLLLTLRNAGADMFNVSARRFHRPAWDGSDLGLVGWAKSLTDAPVIAVGGVGLNTDLASELWKGAQTQPDTVRSLTWLLERFNRGEFDLVAVGRAHLADGEWVAKVRDGRYDEIKPYYPKLLLEIAESWTDGPGDSAHSHALEGSPVA
jgi:2,4-dienoyl-CoA reductase-like NADH-dependent reductase (Old Yellow Enzyme family)